MCFKKYKTQKRYIATNIFCVLLPGLNSAIGWGEVLTEIWLDTRYQLGKDEDETSAGAVVSNLAVIEQKCQEKGHLIVFRSPPIQLDVSLSCQRDTQLGDLSIYGVTLQQRCTGVCVYCMCVCVCALAGSHRVPPD